MSDNTPRAIIVDVVYVAGLPRNQVDVEEVSKTHYKIYTSHPYTLTKTEKMEAISKYRGDDLTFIF